MTRRVPFFDRAREDAADEPLLTAAFQRVVRSGHYILGPEVLAFERACAARIGVAHAIGVSSGTDAILAALLALGVGHGDEVVCPAYTFFATASAIARAGATPVIADAEEDGWNVDPEAVAARIGPRTKAIVAVHLFGRAADMEALARAAGAVPIVEDAAQAFGAALGDRAVGSMGALGCFSFFPTKNLGGFGDGGLVTTNDDALAARARSIRAHGAAEKYLHTILGGNLRLDALQAALLAASLPRLDERLALRASHAKRYTEMLGSIEGLALPAGARGATWNQYVVRVREGRRDALRSFLAGRGVGTEIYYPRPIHLQPALASLGHVEGDFPRAEALAKETLALPIFPSLADDEIAYVAAQIAAFFEGSR